MSPTELLGPDGEPWTPPTTQELLSRGAAPVKREYLRPLRPIAELSKPTAAAAEDGGNGTTPGEGAFHKSATHTPACVPLALAFLPCAHALRPVVCAVSSDGSRGGVNQERLASKAGWAVRNLLLLPMPARGAGDSVRPSDVIPNVDQDQALTRGVRGSEHGTDKNRTGKSRRQQQKEKQASRTTGGELCTAFVKGICNYPNCRYSHDVDLYISAKQGDLPGTCLFIAGGEARPACSRHGLLSRYTSLFGDDTSSSVIQYENKI